MNCREPKTVTTAAASGNEADECKNATRYRKLWRLQFSRFHRKVKKKLNPVRLLVTLRVGHFGPFPLSGQYSLRLAVRSVK